MILVDYSQLQIATFMMHYSDQKVEEGLLRHMVLNNLRSINQMFGSRYGEMVLCCDNRNSWRRGIFPHYKANRKKGRDASGIDWGMVFGILRKIQDEIKVNMPYRMIEIENAEADDVIATLARWYAETPPAVKHLIYSSDKDFIQLHRYPNVMQYSYITKKYITSDDPEGYLAEHILRGDVGDGIPNFLSDDDTFVAEPRKRQTTIRAKKLEEFKNKQLSEFTENEARGYLRNEELIDFRKIPIDLSAQIMKEYVGYEIPDRSKMRSYFIENNLMKLLPDIGDF